MDVFMVSNVIDYNEYLPEQDSTDIRDSVKYAISESLTTCNLDVAKFCYFNSQVESNFVGNDRELYIIANASKRSGDIKEHPRFGKVMASDNNNSTEITVDDTVVANYYFRPNNHNVLNILIDTIRIDDNQKTLKEIMIKLSEIIDRRDSWTHGNKEEMVKSIDRMLSSNKESRLSQYRSNVDRLTSEVESYKENLIRVSRSLQNEIRELKLLEKDDSNLSDKIVKEFDLITQLDKITNLKVLERNIIFQTVKLNFFDENGIEYNGGEYRVEINITNGGIKIYSTYTVSGGWSEKDPHPHVSGSSNVACFGNLTSTLADLIARNEYYALTIMLINYLESVDTTDSVGKYAYRWGRVEDGEIVYDESSTHIGDCDYCGESMYEDDETFDAYMDLTCDDDGEINGVDNHVTICDECRRNEFYYEDAVDEYVSY